MTHIAVNAHLLSPAAGYRQAGVSSYIEQVLRHLWTAGSHVRWTVYAPPGVNAQTLGAPANVRVVNSHLPTTRPVARIFWEQFVAPFRLLADAPDVLLCPLNVIPLLAPCPTVVTVHDLAFIRFRFHRRARGSYLRALTHLSVRRASHVVTVSEFTRREVLELLGVGPEQVTAIANGREARFDPSTPEAVAAFRRREGLPAQFILFVGTLEPRKNVSTLLRAYARVKTCLGMPLLIGGGKGWHYDEVFEVVRTLGLETDVRFLGFIKREDLPAYYAAASAFVYPSLYEGFGFPPLEAMATGTPVVVSSAESLVEVVGDAALVVPPMDVEALARALVRVTTDLVTRATLRERGLVRAQGFSWQRSAEKTLALLQNVAKSARISAVPT